MSGTHQFRYSVLIARLVLRHQLPLPPSTSDKHRKLARPAGHQPVHRSGDLQVGNSVPRSSASRPLPHAGRGPGSQLPVHDWRVLRRRAGRAGRPVRSTVECGSRPGYLRRGWQIMNCHRCQTPQCATRSSRGTVSPPALEQQDGGAQDAGGPRARRAPIRFDGCRRSSR